MRIVRLLALTLSVAAALAVAPSSRAAKGPKAADYLLPAGFVPLTDAEKAMSAVPFAPGAPAVVLLDALQYEHGPQSVHVRRARRVKILTADGLDRAGFSTTFAGEWRIGTVKARTILPDGTEVDATAGVRVQPAKDPDTTAIAVEFPRVQPGAIVDLFIDADVDQVALGEHVVQEDIPVLQNRLMLVPPAGVQYLSAPVFMTEKDLETLTLGYGKADVTVWIFRNVPPLPGVPNMPPRGEISRRLLLVASSYKYGDATVPLAPDWPTYCKDMLRNWDDWLKKSSPKAQALGAQVAGAAPTPRDKAEAVRKAVRERMTRSVARDWPLARSADDALAKGRASTADIAGVAAAMLRAAGVDARLAAYRYRSHGVLPTERPAPSVFDDVLVLVPGAADGGKDLYFAAWSDLPVGQLPEDALGVFVVPFVKDPPGPVLIPDLPPEGNAIESDVSLTLALDGAVKGEARTVARGLAARSWRAELARLSADDRKKNLESYLRTNMPTAVLSSWQVDALDDPTKDLAITLAWEAAGQALKADGRLLLDPFVLSRVSASNWSAEKRDVEVWLGRPFLRKDTVTLKMPEGIESVQLPAPAKLEAPQIGGYVSTYSGKEMTLTSTRQVRFEQTRFPAASWDALRSWFQDMAKSDGQAISFKPADEQP